MLFSIYSDVMTPSVDYVYSLVRKQSCHLDYMRYVMLLLIPRSLYVTMNHKLPEATFYLHFCN